MTLDGPDLYHMGETTHQRVLTCDNTKVSPEEHYSCGARI